MVEFGNPPPGMRSIQAYLVCKDAAAAIEFYGKAFGAKEKFRMPMPDGKTVMHAELNLGDSILMLSEENPQWNTKSPLTLGGTPVTLHCYVADVDAIYNQAVAAGCKSRMVPTNMFWGDRMSSVEDPFGHIWSIAQAVEDVSPAEMNARAAKFFNSQTGACT
ncbi:Glyoxalase-like domain protein [Anatilimnocola aggregata]|uniref:Glyoxalase-like domain protein n=1 Tax=Anatilimnocola aggregata TaxID=2528021 RepID=A0A517YIH7_9BACT|nr:VOC family protein [Anatilimnocola aggregata]QDU30015.1 Glyoxalase-like domain protein [Anatilimnocola aggregata]